jgi:hypothetical protein
MPRIVDHEAQREELLGKAFEIKSFLDNFQTFG